MNQSAPRVAALVAAPLFVVAATALVLLPRGGEGPPPPTPDGPLVVILAPADRATLELEPLAVRARLEDPDGITASELRVGDDEVATAFTSGGIQEEVRFDWEPDDPGDYTLLVRARDNGGNWGQSAVTVSIGTGEPPLPPPPTTSPQTTVELSTTTSASTTVAETTTAGPTTTAPDRPTTTVAPARPTNPPTLPPAPPPTFPPTLPSTLPPTTTTTTVAPTTTTVAPTTTTLAPTTTVATTVATAPTGGSDCRGRRGSAFLFSPFNGSSQVASQPRFGWGYFGCNPVSQVLRFRYSGGGGDIPLAGSARSYTLGFALPACSDVSWDIVSTDASGDSRGTRSSRFTTGGC